MIDTRKPSVSIIWRLAIVVLLALAGLRIATLQFGDPLLAVANNYDMIRVQACIEAYPVREASIPPWAGSYEAPLERYRFTAEVGAPCFLTSEVLFAWAAWPGMWFEQRFLSEGTFSIRWVGAVKLLLFGLIVLLVNRSLLRRGAIDFAAGHAVLVTVVLADPGVSLYLNSFYAEYAAVFFAYLLLALLLLALSDPAAVLSSRLLCGIGLAAALLATSKVQHLLTPLFVFSILLLMRLMGTRIRTNVLAALASGVLLGALIQGLHLASEQTRSMRHANLINTVFYAVLPNADDPLQVTRALGLPDACAAQSGKNWFTPGMQEQTLCPNAFELTRVDLVRVLVAEPALVARVILGGIIRSRPWIPPHLGLVEQQSVGRLPRWHSTLDRVLMALPDRAYLALMTCLPLMAAILILRRRRSDQMAANALLAILATLPLFSVAVVVFGDGYADTPKQSHLGTTTLLAGVCLLVMLALRLALNYGDRAQPIPASE